MQRFAFLITPLIVFGTAHTYQEESQNVHFPEKFFRLESVILPQKIYVFDNDRSENWFTSALLAKLQFAKRAIPMSGGIYGKRAATVNLDSNKETVYSTKQSISPFLSGVYGKRSANVRVPFSGGIYGKRDIVLRSLPISGGIYG